MKSFAQMLKLGLVLTAYSVVACVGLAFVYAGTKTVIAERQQSDLEASLRGLFPQADNFDPVDPASFAAPEGSGISFQAAYAISTGGTPLGVAIKATGKSYGGPAVALIGVGLDGRIAGVRILELKDTPGLGANATAPAYFVDRTAKTTFAGQFAGKAVTDPFKAKEDVIAITASTITSRSIAAIVKAAGQAGAAWLAAQGGK
jgi:electron transport complex protein RnfG